MIKRKKKKLSKKNVAQLLVLHFEQNPEKQYDIRSLYAAVGANNHPQKMLVLDVLDDLLLDDYISKTDDAKYQYAHRSQVMEGTFVRKRNGRNSFLPDDGGQSILVAERNSKHALDGDRVKVTMLARRKTHAREAEVIEIIDRKNDSFVGELKVSKDYAFLITSSRSLANDIFIPQSKLNGGKTGDKAVVEIIEWPEGAKSPVGKVTQLLGQNGNNDAEMCAILVEYGLPYTYPKDVEEAADHIPEQIPESEAKKREDFRQVTTFTIDPKDAKDFDDAISIRQRPDENGRKVYEIGVHIADVTYYVKEGDIIDKEAYKRATSVYLVDRTIPMLPERLCNKLCSLRQDEDKVAYSCIFDINEDGEIIRWHPARTMIRSNKRFAYEDVQYVFERNGLASEQDYQTPGKHPQKLPKGTPLEGEYARELCTLNHIAKKMREKRFKNGAIGFDRPEIRFEIDEKGHPISTYVKIAKDANKLIEEYMLLANKSVAQLIGNPTNGKKAKTFVYRIHDVPDPEKLETLNGFIGRFGYILRTEGSKKQVSKSLNHLLEEVHGKPEAKMVEMVALRSMSKARYSTQNIGHYGLMFDFYTHFTSPIRRYPDMMVHRLLSHYLDRKGSADPIKYEELCEHSSAMELLAQNAERASIKYKQVEFMGDRIGQEFEGTIAGVTEFGLYVELDANGCEGMIPLRDLIGDYYEFDEKNYCLVGRRYHKRYALGDRVKIKVERANLERRQLDFSLIEKPEDQLPAIEKPQHKSDKKRQIEKKKRRVRKK